MCVGIPVGHPAVCEMSAQVAIERVAHQDTLAVSVREQLALRLEAESLDTIKTPKVISNFSYTCTKSKKCGTFTGKFAVRWNLYYGPEHRSMKWTICISTKPSGLIWNSLLTRCQSTLRDWRSYVISLMKESDGRSSSFALSFWQVRWYVLCELFLKYSIKVLYNFRTE